MSPDLSRALSEAAGTAEDLPDLQLISQRTRAIVRRRWLGRALVLGVVVAALAIAGDTLDLNLSSPVAPATRPGDPPVHELKAFTGLNPGLYRSDFDPPFEFRMTSEGWFSGATESTWTYLTYKKVHLHFQRWSQVVDPAARRSGSTVLRSLPVDLTTWLLRHPLLEITKREAVTVGGLEGTLLEVRTTGSNGESTPECEGERCVVLARVGGLQEVVDLGENETARFYILDGETAPIVIHWAAPPRVFDAITPELERVLASMKP